jgi:DNA-binding beta-propeller fold protein YncE
VNKPGDIYVWPKTNELFIADGYGNRRVLVLDADTFAFKRMWGAFGKPPRDDATSGGRGANGGPLPVPGAPRGGEGRGAAPALDTEGPGPDIYASPVHGVLVSNDGILYVVDRSNRRVQLFTPDGKYLTQMFLNRAGPSSGSVSGLAFSPDPAQKFLYLSDYGNSHIAVVDRKALKVLYQFGVRGPEPGNFQGVHHIAVDSKGNIYTAEVAPGARAQKFLYKGMSPTLPANALTDAQLAAKP